VSTKKGEEQSNFLLIVSRFNKLDEVLVDKINLRLSENKKE
jgi:hypothetical protein